MANIAKIPSPGQSSVWAAIDGILQRGVSAAVAFVLALVSSPASVGAYSVMLVALSLHQMAIDIPARHVAIRIAGDRDAERRVLRALRLAAILASIVLCCVVVAAVALDRFDKVTGMMLLPITCVPIASALNVIGLATLQRGHLWRSVAKVRLIGFGLASVVTVPLLLGTGLLVFASVQVLLSEIVVTIVVGVVRSARSAQTGSLNLPRVDGLEMLTHTATYQGLAWLRVQVDRIALASFGTPAALGVYSVGFSLGRAFLEAPLGSMMNVLRARLANDAQDDPAVVRSVVSKYALKVQLLGSLGWAAVLLLIAPVSLLVLGEEWHQAVKSAAILAAALPSTIQLWCLDTAASHSGLLRKGYAGQTLGVLLGIGVGIALSVDIILGSYMYLGRELVLAAVAAVAYRRLTTGRSTLAWLAFSGLSLGSGILCSSFLFA